MGQGTIRAARQVDVCEPSSQRVVFVPLAGDVLKFVNKRSDLAFVGIQMNAGPFAELVVQIKKDDNVLDRIGDEGSVVRVPLDDKLLATRGDAIFLIRGA